jgi:hypothetical protein
MIPFGRPRVVPGTGDNKKILSPLFIPRHEESHSKGVGFIEGRIVNNPFRYPGLQNQLSDFQEATPREGRATIEEWIAFALAIRAVPKPANQ